MLYIYTWCEKFATKWLVSRTDILKLSRTNPIQKMENTDFLILINNDARQKNNENIKNCSARNFALNERIRFGLFRLFAFAPYAWVISRYNNTGKLISLKMEDLTKDIVGHRQRIMPQTKVVLIIFLQSSAVRRNNAKIGISLCSDSIGSSQLDDRLSRGQPFCRKFFALYKFPVSRAVES